MTEDDLALLRRSTDHVVAIELVTGEQFFAEIVILVEESPTPDVLLIRVEREPDGVFVAKDEAGESILLSAISRVAPLPWVKYPPAESEM